MASIFALLMLPGCFLEELKGSDSDSTSTTDSEPQDSEHQDSEPQDSEPQDSEPQDSEPVDQGEALVRFVNLSDGGDSPARFMVGETAGAELYFTQSAHYQSFPAGSHDVSIVDSGSGATLSNLIGYEFEDGKKYTVAAMGLHMGHPNTWVNVDSHVDETDIASDRTRLTVVNATPDTRNGVYAQLQYPDDTTIDTFMYNNDQLLNFVQQTTFDAPFALMVYLNVEWGVPAAYTHYWNGSAFVQVTPGSAMYMFFTCTGSCSSDSDRMVLGMMEDSSTFTVEDAPQ